MGGAEVPDRAVGKPTIRGISAVDPPSSLRVLTDGCWGGTAMWETFADGELRIEVSVDDPVLLIVVGEVNVRTWESLLQALEFALSLPGTLAIELNIRLARFAGLSYLLRLVALQEQARTSDHPFTIYGRGQI